MRIFISRLLLIPALCTALLAGCSDDETGPKEPLIRTPKPGSGFSYTYYNLDTNGQRIDQTMRTVSRHVLANGVTVMGRENVVQYMEDSDTISLHYEADGDASYLQSPIAYPGDEFPSMPGIPIPNITVPARWITFAFGSKTTQEIPDYDTTVMVDFNGLPLPISIEAEGATSYIGTEDISVSGETIATQGASDAERLVCGVAAGERHCHDGRYHLVCAEARHVRQGCRFQPGKFPGAVRRRQKA